MTLSPVLLITPGDPEGIGPEVVWKAIRNRHRSRPEVSAPALLCIGARAPFDRLGAEVIEQPADAPLVPPAEGRRRPPRIWLLPAPTRAPRGKLLAGYQSGWSITTAVGLLRRAGASALVTGPISKERLRRGGFPYPGHTEFLAALCKVRGRTPRVTMMLANDGLRVTLVTTHLALRDVPRALTRKKLRETVLQTAEHLRRWWGIARPRIGVAALNPHAGEGGLFGDEEIRVITPELRALTRNARGRFVLEGPLPADTLFAKESLRRTYDAVVCMYHDQGLIPVKQLDFQGTVNVTLGLPIIRTSVDHGVGFDIAGKGVADPSSLEAAIALATRLASHALPSRGFS